MSATADLDATLADTIAPLGLTWTRTSDRARAGVTRSKSGYRRKSSRRLSTAQRKRRATFAAIPGAELHQPQGRSVTAHA